MLNTIFGKKIGMTQIFSKDGRVYPVTAIKLGRWVITQIKTEEKDGYNSLQLGLLRDKIDHSSLDSSFVKNKKKFFSTLKEVHVDGAVLAKTKLGKLVSFEDIDINENDKVKVSGRSKGLGFQGVVKRWNFSGGPKSHGSNFHRIPGSIGNICSQGKVLKGKQLPGHAGNKMVSVKNLQVVKLDKENGVLFVKGAIPGKKESLVRISK